MARIRLDFQNTILERFDDDKIPVLTDEHDALFIEADDSVIVNEIFDSITKLSKPFVKTEPITMTAVEQEEEQIAKFLARRSTRIYMTEIAAIKGEKITVTEARFEATYRAQWQS